MTAQHTPGPWKATGSAANYTPPGDRSDRSAMMDWSSGIDGPAPFTENEHGNFEECDEQQVARGFGRTVEEAKANALLIAAAPELLEALNDIVRSEWTTVTLESLTPQHRRRLERARAAIAKATGSAA
jgi:hypothetical protein